MLVPAKTENYGGTKTWLDVNSELWLGVCSLTIGYNSWSEVDSGVLVKLCVRIKNSNLETDLFMFSPWGWGYVKLDTFFVKGGIFSNNILTMEER